MTTGCTAINTTVTTGNVTTNVLANLDLCTVEGIPLVVNSAASGANRVLGINATLNDIPVNTCKVDATQPAGFYDK